MLGTLILIPFFFFPLSLFPARFAVQSLAIHEFLQRTSAKGALPAVLPQCGSLTQVSPIAPTPTFLAKTPSSSSSPSCLSCSSPYSPRQDTSPPASKAKPKRGIISDSAGAPHNSVATADTVDIGEENWARGESSSVSDEDVVVDVEGAGDFSDRAGGPCQSQNSPKRGWNYER